MKKILLCGGLLVISGCASVPLNKQTASGWPEAIFKNAQIDVIKNRSVAFCNNRGMSLREASSNKVVCSQVLTGSNAILTQLAIGNAYSTQPEEVTQFTHAQIGQDVLVGIRVWRETQMPFGQLQRVELKNAQTINYYQSILDQAVEKDKKALEAPLNIQSAPPPM